MKRIVMAAAVAALALGGCVTAGIEEPAFTVAPMAATAEAVKGFEIREYPAVITAETRVSGAEVKARNDGFMPLADYIFAKDRKGGKIAMTAPVTQAAPREKIAMTAPVGQKAAGDKAGGDDWVIAFTMPAKYTMATLPPPADPRVKLVEHPPRRVAVLRYSGFSGAEKMAAKKQELLAAVAKAGLKAGGEAEFAFYDPPWTPPFLRRNEVMVELAQP